HGAAVHGGAGEQMRQRKFWGWGWEDGGPDAEQQQRLAQALVARFDLGSLNIAPAPRLEELTLPPSRCSIPTSLASFCSSEAHDRAGHTYGKSFRDVVRAFRRRFDNPPDVVAHPHTESDLVATLDWCSTQRIAAIPYGGGSSVVGGIEPPDRDSYPACVSIDLSRLDRVLEVDKRSRAARIQCGAYGPAIEEQLRPHGYTLRHFPQSFEFSSLGGWIATRSGGHFATLYTHIDDFVESLRVVTPSGTIESRRLPGSGAGPSPDRLFIGSEGTLGVITEAWMRLQDRPTLRNSVSVTFADFTSGSEAVRAISQSGLYPANCRLLDPIEALTAGAGSGQEAVLVLGFESADHGLDPWMARALECCRDHGGKVPEGAGKTRSDSEATREGPAGAWRRAFLDGPYLRDVLVALQMVSETFETAITWDRFPEFHLKVMATVLDAVRRICGRGQVSCRFTHVYPDGPAPYYSILAPARPNSQIEQWMEIKKAASEAVIENGGTITHHHAVGRDHRPWYDRQRPEGFARALAAAKRELDPSGILNPGVLIDLDSVPSSTQPKKG
ncbi:MAG TPA: FAD-binding oxidoreductase, partial [Candidatus Acidoferrales bacterium]|nr:FAD-binding oxidoreductase [Candidatus Acidoferrales bacterium]